MQTGKQEILGLSADDAPDEVPPVGDVRMKCYGFIAIDDVESGVDAPQKIVGERCDYSSEVPPDSSEDDWNDKPMGGIVPRSRKTMNMILQIKLEQFWHFGYNLLQHKIYDSLQLYFCN